MKEGKMGHQNEEPFVVWGTWYSYTCGLSLDTLFGHTKNNAPGRAIGNFELFIIFL